MLEWLRVFVYLSYIATGSRRPGHHKSASLCRWALMTTSTTKRTPQKRPSRKGPVCTLCKHPDRVLIEQTRVAGASLDSIAAKFGVSRDIIHRHMHRHVSEDLRSQYLAGVPLKQLAQRATAEGMSVLEYLSLIRSTLMNEFQLAANVHDRHATSALAGRLNETLREIGRITGEIMRSPAVMNVSNSINITNSPVFIDLQQMLIRRLAGHPQALAAVVDGLRELESRSAPRPIAGPLIDHQGEAHAVA